MDGKTKAIVAHIYWIGWVIALILNSSDKDELTSFYIRQLLGLFLLSLVLMFIPIIGWLANIIIFVFWIISLIGAINGEQKLVPVVGKLFQDWFKGL
ncbi:YtxH domain-containing protein [Maribellus luteus]|uniref:YtxH domain-containing protein n=1 Tax=Maribellus luteus TaxID=2305463 RepID=A0A399SUZ1_9BACT|nr:YtxH domain-containing protein [Maribellus luteus]RIJ47218.1 YtxH domain-containing protein [Maribellus luteus]